MSKQIIQFLRFQLTKNAPPFISWLKVFPNYSHSKEPYALVIIDSCFNIKSEAQEKYLNNARPLSTHTVPLFLRMLGKDV